MEERVYGEYVMLSLMINWGRLEKLMATSNLSDSIEKRRGDLSDARSAALKVNEYFDGIILSPLRNRYDKYIKQIDFEFQKLKAQETENKKATREELVPLSRRFGRAIAAIYHKI